MSRRLRNSAASASQEAGHAGAASSTALEVGASIPAERPNKRKIEDTDDADITFVEPGETSESTGKKAKLEYTKHGRFWLLDGNVQLQIGPTRFNLHRSRLASQSPWFEALFEKRAGENLEVGEGGPDLDKVVFEDEEGTEVIYLDSTKVTSDDFAELLTAMDDAIDFCDARPRVPRLAAIYRAASSLQFAKLKAYALKRLCTTFPNTMPKTGSKVQRYTADVVILARDWGLPQLLKRAFYDIARDKSLDSPFLKDERSTEELNPRDLFLLSWTQRKLTLEWAEILSFKTGTYKCKNCQSDSLSYLWRVVHSSGGISEKYATDPIRGMQALIDLDWTTYGHCDACQTRRRLEMTERQKKLWADLDNWLKIEVPGKEGQGGRGDSGGGAQG